MKKKERPYNVPVMKSSPPRIAVIGAGHVGLITAAAFSDVGYQVTAMDNDEKKIAQLQQGTPPFYEPGLDALLTRNLRRKRLFFTGEIAEAVARADYVFICVGTPPKASGEADLSAVDKVGRQIGQALTGYKLIIEKSTVPVQTGRWLEKTIRINARKGAAFDVVCNPEFLREGSAVHDALHPDRIVIGVESERARRAMEKLYAPFNAPILFCNIQTAEMIKHASNAFLSTKISYINAISFLCEAVGADVEKVAEGMGLDPRIGRAFLNAGVGYGGFCFPKDLQAFIRIAREAGYDFRLLKETARINDEARRRFVQRVKQELWVLKEKHIALLGLAFKPGTDDMRFAPSLDIIRQLKAEGARVSAYDPVAGQKAQKQLKGVLIADSAYDALNGAHAACLVTEWEAFRKLDWRKAYRLMSPPRLVADGRNCLDPAKMRRLGFAYFAPGRP